MSTNENVSDTQPPDGRPQSSQHNTRAIEAETSDHEKYALIEKLRTQLSAATLQNEHNCTLMSIQKEKISQLEAATEAHKGNLDNANAKLKDASTQHEHDKQLIDNLQQKGAQLKGATDKSEQYTTLIDAFCEKVSHLHGPAKSELEKKLIQAERRIRLSERCDLLQMYSRLLELKRVILKAEDKAAQREHVCATRLAELDTRAEQLKLVQDSLAQDPDPKQRDLAAKMEQSFNNGKKHVIVADQSKAKALRLDYKTYVRQVKSTGEHYDALLAKMKAFAEDPVEWHNKIKDLDGIEARRATHEGTKQPEKSSSPEETRFIEVTSNQRRNERNITTWEVMRAMSGLWLIEKRVLPGKQMTEFFEADISKLGHIGQIGFHVGRAIQTSILWRQGGYIDRNSVLLPGSWTEQDLEPPGDVDKLPTKLAAFWKGVGFGAAQSHEDYARMMEQSNTSQSG
ncbi:hypothetical protein DE146DRAFT_732101 [Phaeosphaeria sp. MPI-PUGE-AT-0046c]|nr:hypothetical protein DE146DRAFT_732101 [Phaeosphaeria sp. MPI-PUGE-AT-0046c]